MSPLAVLRISGAQLMVPCIFALGVWVALSNAGDSATGYSVNNLAVASGQLVLTGPLVAAYLAYRVPGLFTLLRTARPTRSPVSVLGVLSAPVLLGGPVAGTLAMVSATRVLPRSTADWQVVGVTFAAGVACASFGALVALVIPRFLAIPLVAAATFAWIAIPGSRLEIVPRNLNSGFVACCSDDQQPAVAMVLGSAALDLVLVLGCLFLLWQTAKQRIGRLALAAGLVVVIGAAAALGTASAASAPGKLSLLAVEARSSKLTCAQQGYYRVCVWPENRARVGRSFAALRNFDAALLRAGLPGAPSVSERPGPGSDALQATAAARASIEDLRFSLVVGYVERASTCGGLRAPHSPSTAVAAVALASGMTPTELADQGASPRTVTAAQTVVDLSPSALGAWFHDQTCGDAAGSSP